MIAAIQSYPVLRLLIGIAALVIVVLGFREASGFLSPVLFAILLAILVEPLVGSLQFRGLPRALALIVVSLGIVVAFVAVSALLIASTSQLVARVPDYQALMAQRLQPGISWLNSRGLEASDFRGLVTGADATRAMVGLITEITNSLSSGVFLLFIVLFLLSDAPGLWQRTQRVWGTDSRPAMAFAQFSRTVSSQLRIQSIVNLMSAILVAVGLAILGVDFAFLWGVLSFFLAYIPNVGVPIATVPAVLLALVQFGWGTALAVVALVAVVNLVIYNLVAPRMTSTGADLSAAVVFIGFIFWSWVFGPLGALLAVPLTALLKILFQLAPSARWISAAMSSRIDDAMTPMESPLAQSETGLAQEEGDHQRVA